MDKRLAKHLKGCKIDRKHFEKLVRLIKGFLESCQTVDQLVTKFADKCYGKEKDRKMAKVQARTFLEFLFGSVSTILKYGPEVAIGTLLRKKYVTSSNEKKVNLIEVQTIQKEESSKFNVHLHEPDDKDIEIHPMWTRSLKQYLIGPTLGVGGTAKVKLAYDTKARRKVALKIVKPKYIESAKLEMGILKNLNHKNVVRVYDCFANVLWDNERTTVFSIEYANQGELIEFLMYTSKFEDDLARWFFVSLTEGIEYCHGQKIIHRDLKHDNCLLGENFILKITDFGFATYYKDEMMKTAIGTAQYAAPEILRGKKYTEAVDIFSMGVMLFIALAGSQPWRKASAKSDRWFKMVHSGNWKKFFSYHERSHTFSIEQKIIIKGLLEPNPENRWTINDIKRCSWFNGKKISQNKVALRLQKRKRIVDNKKFKAMESTTDKVVRRGFEIDIFSDRLPYVYFQPPPRLSFVTDKKPEWILQDIENVIFHLKGTITKKDVEKFKLTFHLTKWIETGRYINKRNKEKEYEKVRICASAQIWTHPGQKNALQEREKQLTALKKSKEKMTKKEEAMAKNIPTIKSIAIFRVEGGGESRYLFPSIYNDILLALPSDVISRNQMG